MQLVFLLYVFLSLCFYGFAVFHFEGLLSFVSVLLLILLSGYVACFSFKSEAFPDAWTHDRLLTDRRILHVLFFLSFGPLVLAYIVFGVPAFASNPEYARVHFAGNLGIYNRLYPMFIYAGVILCAVLRSVNRVSTAYFLLWVISSFSLIFLSGFRAKIFDVVFLVLIGSMYRDLLSKGFLRAMGKHLSLGLFFLTFSFCLIYAITQTRFSGVESPLLSIAERVFLINYVTNLERIADYVDIFGYALGRSYLSDVFSIFVPSVLSFSDQITVFFTGQDIFKMTPTVYGEGIYNFGNFFIVSVFVVVFWKLTIEAMLNLFLYPANSRYFYLSVRLMTIYVFTRSIITLGISSAFLVKVLPIFICLFLLSIIFLLFGVKFKAGMHF